MTFVAPRIEHLCAYLVGFPDTSNRNRAAGIHLKIDLNGSSGVRADVLHHDSVRDYVLHCHACAYARAYRCYDNTIVSPPIEVKPLNPKEICFANLNTFGCQ
jgi:hypothetical protein